MLRSRVMQIGEESRKEVGKDRRIFLREEKKKRKSVEVRRIKGERKALIEVTVKIGLKRIDT